MSPRTKSREWVVIVAENTHPTVRESHWHCERCGERVVIASRMLVPTFVAMGEGFSRAHAHCSADQVTRVEPTFSVDTRDSIDRRAKAWQASGEVGMSSLAIWQHMFFGSAVGSRFAGTPYPLDPSDFRRCRLLLAAIPEWRVRIGEMERYGPEWCALVAAWGELDALYDEEVGERSHGTAPSLYRRMKALTRGAA